MINEKKKNQARLIRIKNHAYFLGEELEFLVTILTAWSAHILYWSQTLKMDWKDAKDKKFMSVQDCFGGKGLIQEYMKARGKILKIL